MFYLSRAYTLKVNLNCVLTNIPKFLTRGRSASEDTSEFEKSQFIGKKNYSNISISFLISSGLRI